MHCALIPFLFCVLGLVGLAKGNLSGFYHHSVSLFFFFFFPLSFKRGKTERKRKRAGEPTKRANKRLKAKLRLQSHAIIAPSTFALLFGCVFIFYFLFLSLLVGFPLSCDNTCVFLLLLPQSIQRFAVAKTLKPFYF